MKTGENNEKLLLNIKKKAEKEKPAYFLGRNVLHIFVVVVVKYLLKGRMGGCF